MTRAFNSAITVLVAVVTPVAVLFCGVAWWSIARLRNLGAQRPGGASEANEINYQRWKNRLDMGRQPRLYEIWTRVVYNEKARTENISSVESFEETKPLMCTPKSPKCLQVWTLIRMPTPPNELNRIFEVNGSSETVLASASVAFCLPRPPTDTGLSPHGGNTAITP